MNEISFAEEIATLIATKVVDIIEEKGLVMAAPSHYKMNGQNIHRTTLLTRCAKDSNLEKQPSTVNEEKDILCHPTMLGARSASQKRISRNT